MHDDVYDSPTFLGEKDTYLMGLTLVQLVILMAIGAFIFMVSFMMPFGSLIVRILFVVPSTGLFGLVMFVRLTGLSIPAYVFLSIASLLRRPSFEETRELLLSPDPRWVEAQAQRGGTSRIDAFRRRARTKADAMDFDSRAAEAKAEVDKQVSAGALSAKQWVEDGARTLLKGK